MNRRSFCTIHSVGTGVYSSVGCRVGESEYLSFTLKFLCDGQGTWPFCKSNFPLYHFIGCEQVLLHPIRLSIVHAQADLNLHCALVMLRRILWSPEIFIYLLCH